MERGEKFEADQDDYRFAVATAAAVCAGWGKDAMINCQVAAV